MPQKSDKLSKMVLVVDDEMGPRYSVRMAVADRYNCHTVASGEEAVEFVRKNTVDVAVVDLKMPRMSGIDVLRCIREISPVTRVIILTGYETEETYLESLRLGAYDYLIKPFDVSHLGTVIDEAMTGSNSASHSVVATLLVGLQSREAPTHHLRRSSLPDELQGVMGAYLHDLKGELLNLSAFAEQLRTASQDNPDAKAQCDYIQESTALAQVFVRRLLDYLRLAGSNRQSITVSALISRVESLVRPRLPSTTQFLVNIQDVCFERVLSIDPEQIVGVLLELIHNAARALPHEGGKIELGVRMKRLNVLKPPHIAISVKDNGCGLPHEIRSGLFKRRLVNVHGQGLGLYLASKAVRNLDGQVILQSSNNNGSTFTVLLPIVLPPPLRK